MATITFHADDSALIIDGDLGLHLLLEEVRPLRRFTREQRRELRRRQQRLKREGPSGAAPAPGTPGREALLERRAVLAARAKEALARRAVRKRQKEALAERLQALREEGEE